MSEKRHPLGTKENFELIQTILNPKVIDGALRSAIHAHGQITSGSRILRLIEKDAKGNDIVTEIVTCSTSSASKRIRGAIRTKVVEYLAEQERKKTPPPKEVWYNRFVRWLKEDAPFP